MLLEMKRNDTTDRSLKNFFSLFKQSTASKEIKGLQDKDKLLNEKVSDKGSRGYKRVKGSETTVKNDN